MSETEDGTDRLATGHPQYPWRDEDLMRELYHEKQMSTTEIADELDCAYSTVSQWIGRLGIEKRSRAEAAAIALGEGLYRVPFQTHTTGPECWRHTYKSEKNTVYVHRLVAVAKYGYDAVAGNDVHHKNEIPWDNRPENLTVMTHGEHSSHHKKVSGLDRLRIAELYENGDVSYRELHDILDYDHINWQTVMDIHHEFTGRGRHAA